MWDGVAAFDQHAVRGDVTDGVVQPDGVGVEDEVADDAIGIGLGKRGLLANGVVLERAVDSGQAAETPQVIARKTAPDLNVASRFHYFTIRLSIHPARSAIQGCSSRSNSSV